MQCLNSPCSIFIVRTQHGRVEEVLKEEPGHLSPHPSTGPSSATAPQWGLGTPSLVSLDLSRVLYKIRKFARSLQWPPLSLVTEDSSHKEASPPWPKVHPSFHLGVILLYSLQCSLAYYANCCCPLAPPGGVWSFYFRPSHVALNIRVLTVGTIPGRTQSAVHQGEKQSKRSQLRH